jgi:hypothetical protein
VDPTFGNPYNDIGAYSSNAASMKSFTCLNSARQHALRGYHYPWTIWPRLRGQELYTKARIVSRSRWKSARLRTRLRSSSETKLPLQ